jgi:nucleotide-binding universal stress UspA family protein
MPKIKKIIAATDLSKLSLAGVRYAMEMGRDQGAAVIVYHVIDSEGDRFAGRDDLSQADTLVPRQKQRLVEFIKENCADLLGKVELQQVVDLGVPYKKIVEKAEKEGADLVVISTHGRTGVDQFLLGSVTQRVVARAPCPVLSIRPTERQRGRKAAG